MKNYGYYGNIGIVQVIHSYPHFKINADYSYSLLHRKYIYAISYY